MLRSEGLLANVQKLKSKRNCLCIFTGLIKFLYLLFELISLGKIWRHVERAVFDQHPNFPRREALNAHCLAVALDLDPATWKSAEAPVISAADWIAIGREKLIARFQLGRLGLFRRYACNDYAHSVERSSVAAFVRDTVQFSFSKFRFAHAEADELLVESGFVNPLRAIDLIEILFLSRAKNSAGEGADRLALHVARLANLPFARTCLMPFSVDAKIGSSRRFRASQLPREDDAPIFIVGLIDRRIGKSGIYGELSFFIFKAQHASAQASLRIVLRLAHIAVVAESRRVLVLSRLSPQGAVRIEFSDHPMIAGLAVGLRARSVEVSLFPTETVSTRLVGAAFDGVANLSG